MKVRRESKTRTLRKQETQRSGKPATVVAAAGPWWVLKPDAADNLILSTLSGSCAAPESHTIVTVGDLVDYVEDLHETGQGVIVRVHPRRTFLSRKAAGRAIREQVLVANVDKLAIIVAADLPPYKKRMIDRYLIAAEKGGLEPAIVVNKVDLSDPVRVIIDLVVYADRGIPVFVVSAKSGHGLKGFREYLSSSVTLFAGPSGVGKSSLTNCLTDAERQIADLTRKYAKGRHTTSAATIVPLTEGGAIVDSPGLREFAIWQVELDELPFYFEEFTPFAFSCHFQPCSHTHEPDCAVRTAVEEGVLDIERYESYIILYDELTSPSRPR